MKLCIKARNEMKSCIKTINKMKVCIKTINEIKLCIKTINAMKLCIKTINEMKLCIKAGGEWNEIMQKEEMSEMKLGLKEMKLFIKAVFFGNYNIMSFLVCTAQWKFAGHSLKAFGNFIV